MGVRDAELILSTLGQQKAKAHTVADGTVVSVKGSTAYVTIDGGAQRVPCQLAMAAKAGDKVKVSIYDHSAVVTGNTTEPATGDAEAKAARERADEAFLASQEAQGSAQTAAESAQRASSAASAAQTSAGEARTAASTAIGEAQTATAAATTAQGMAQTASDKADEASASAYNANEYAARALGHLGTVESVTETLTWITEHGTMELTSDTEPDPTHVYFVANENGAYTVGGSKYDIVVEPDPNDMASYYELTIDESLQNYVGTHMALTDEGLWLIPEDGTGYRILVSTGGGSYDAGTHIIDSGGDSVAKLGDEIVLGRPEDSQVVIDSDSMEIDDYGNAYFFVGRKASDESYARHTDTFVGDGSSQTFYLSASGVTVESLTVDGADTPFEVGMVLPSGRRYVELETPPASGAVIKVVSYDNSPNLTFGRRATGSQVGEYSVSEGWGNEASGRYSHADGYATKASGEYSRAGGRETKASDFASEASGYKTISSGKYQNVFGRSNVEDGKYVEIVGNGYEYNEFDTPVISEIFDDWGAGPTFPFTLRQTPTSVYQIDLVDGFGDSTEYEYGYAISGRVITLDTNPTVAYERCEKVRIKYEIGTSRSNARTLDLDGNEQLAGGIYVGATNEDDSFVESDKGIGPDGTANLSGLSILGQPVPPTFYYANKPSESDLTVKPCIVIQTSDWSVWYCDNEATPAYHQLTDNTKVSKSGDTMTGQLVFNGSDILLKTYGSSSNDSGDIVWFYGNGREKSRIWANDTYTSSAGPNYRVYKEDGTLLYNGTIACMIAGIICPFGGSSAPSGFLMCNGQAVSRTTYAALFAVIGTTYGGGNGSTTFNVPDLRGRTVIGSNSSHALGSTGGAETVKLSKNESALPAHGHGFTQPTVNGGATTTGEKSLTGWTALYSDMGMFNPGNNYRYGIISQGGVRSTSYRPAWTGGTSYDMNINASHSHPQVAHTHSVTGGAVSQNNGWDASQAHNNMQPFVTINYIISTGG